MVPDRFKAGIARYQPSDAADLGAFQMSTFGIDGRQLDPERFDWLFRRNPHLGDDGPPLWICRRKGEIVGQQAEIPFTMVVDGTPIPAGWAIDLMVAADWRIRGVGPGLVATHAEQRGFVVGLTQTEDAVNIYLRNGWTEVGSSVPAYMRVLDARTVLRTAPFGGRARSAAPVAGVGLRALDAALAGVGWLAGLRLVPVRRFDARVDEVWEAARGDYCVLARRDAATVAWNIDQRPEADLYHRFYLVKGGRTLGYVVFRTTEHWGGRTMSVVDYLAPARWVAPMLTLAGHAARREGAFALMCRTFNTPAERSLRAAGFVLRGAGTTAPLRMFVHSTLDDAAVDAAVVRPEAWFLTAADADLS